MSRPLQADKERAAILIAEGRYEYAEIAHKVGISVRALYKWRCDKKFADRVDQLCAEFSARFKRLAIARREMRISVLNQQHTKLLELQDERSKEMDGSIAGGSTGLLVRQYKVSGENTVTEYAFDAAVVREIRALEEQAAKELGQLVEKHEHKIRSLKDLSDEELAAILEDGDDEERAAEGEGSEGDRAQEEGDGAGRSSAE